MALPVKLQANILSWMTKDSIPALDSAPPRAPDDIMGAEERASTKCDCVTSLSPTELFSLSSAAAAAGSPCVVIKDRFLGKEQASRVHDGELHTLLVEETARVWLDLLVYYYSLLFYCLCCNCTHAYHTTVVVRTTTVYYLM